MNIVIAALLLFFLMSIAGRKHNGQNETVRGNHPGNRSEDTSWIDELEILDIIDDDNF